MRKSITAISLSWHQLKINLSNLIHDARNKVEELKVRHEHGAPLFPPAQLLSDTDPLPALTPDQLVSIQTTAADLSQWKPVAKPPKLDRSDARDAQAVQKIDAAMLALIDLAPERFSWQVTELCEKLISDIDPDKHLTVMTELMGLMPIAFYVEAMNQIAALTLAAGRETHTFNGPWIDRRSLERKGWLTA